MSKRRFVRMMVSIAGCCLALAAAVVSAPQAHASWSSFASTGTTAGVGSPSCAQASSEHVVCAVLSGKAEMMVNEYNETKWGTWASLAGTIVSAPSCTPDGTGKVFCAAMASTGDMEVSIFSGTSWGTPTQVTAALYSAPSCAKYVEGEVLCAARNAAGEITWSLYSSGKWSAFATLPFISLYAPYCASDDNSGVICSLITSTGTTVVDRYAAGSWKGSLNLAGEANNPTDCTYWKTTGQVACFAESTDSSLFVNTFNGGTWSVKSWSGYENLGGVGLTAPSCTTQATGDLVCGVIGTQTNEFYSNVYTASTEQWSGWTLVGGKGVGSPSCVPFETNKAMCVVTGENNELTSTVGP